MSEDSGSQFRDEVLSSMPVLGKLALEFTRESAKADALVQETLRRAWQHQAFIVAGGRVKMWLPAILRNLFYSSREDRWQTNRVAEREGEEARKLFESWKEPADAERALALLPDKQREAIVLVGAGSFSLEEAASICNCAVSTMKGRVTRARKKLVATLESN